MKKFLSKRPFSDYIALVALILSIYTTVRGENQQRNITRLETSYLREVEAHVVENSLVRVLATKDFDKTLILPSKIQNPPAGVAAVWVEVRVSNTGLRTFSITELLGGMDPTLSGDVYILGSFGYPNLKEIYKRPTATPSNLVRLPTAIQPGEQIRFYIQLVLPVGPETASRLKKGRYLTSSVALLMDSTEELKASQPEPSLDFTASYLRVAVLYADGDDDSTVVVRIF